MISIENKMITGWEATIRGMRNPMNSWEKSDSYFADDIFRVGEDDMKLMQGLASGGDDDAKFTRFITVTCDITAPLYWWKQFDTYKVGTVANSCSTMHKLCDQPFEYDMFSHENLDDRGFGLLGRVIDYLNECREEYRLYRSANAWNAMIQTLPTSYNQKRTVLLNYQVLKHMYDARKNHKLKEWHDFCDWVLTLPLFVEIYQIDEE